MDKKILIGHIKERKSVMDHNMGEYGGQYAK
jgi:hypothetical protein